MPRVIVALLVGFLSFASRAQAANIVIEPDNYAEGAVLNDVNPKVQLRCYSPLIGNQFPQNFGEFPDPTVIPVTANENDDISGGWFTSTGIKSFGGGNIAWFSEDDELGMRFLVPTSRVTIDFIGTSSLRAQYGVLKVYSAAGALLDTFTSGARFSHQIATLSLSRPAGDIGYARAYSSDDGSPFGAFDNLRFETLDAVPGDYNGDLFVNTADYTVWRNTRGAIGPNQPADGSGPAGIPDNVVDRWDFDFWKQRYAAMHGSGSGLPADASGVASVPEPAGAFMLLVAIAWGIVIGGRERRGQ
jgi:hypothetical protein